MSRPVTRNYDDPLSSVWIAAAQKMGLTIKRGADSYASTDGMGILTLSDDAGMDADDCLAQMILHEICHSMIQGAQSFGWVDWGLDNEGTRDTELEHACLRLQAALLDPLGLRVTLGPTTDFRSYYDALPEDPFEERAPVDRESITRARTAYARRHRPPWRAHLEGALLATSAIAQQARAALPDTKLTESASLWATVEAPRDLNQVKLPMHPESALTCATCAWSFEGGRGKKVNRCRQAEDAPIDPTKRACERYEATFDCLSCGACCREAYDTVEVSKSDPAAKLHLNLLVERSGGYDVMRDGARCACLRGGIELTPPVPSIAGGTSAPDEGQKNAPLIMPGGASFTCSIYETRPQTCRDFTISSEHCLSARRTVGLSR